MRIRKWRPIKSAPKDGSTVMLLVPTLYGKWNKNICVTGMWLDSYWIIFHADEAIQRVEATHWMQLPELPE